MQKINYARVLIGGVVAGIILLAMDFLGMTVLGFDMKAWAAQHALTEPSPAVWVVMDLLFGILIVWLYAAIRPRFGVGPRTAAIAAAFVWAFFTIMFGGFHAMGLYTQVEFMKFAAWGIPQVFGATLAGAWLYKEA